MGRSRTTDILDAASACRRALGPRVDRDWDGPAGSLTWSVRATVAHVTDAVGWYAAQLAARSPRRLPVDVRVHDDAANADLLDVLDAAAAMLTAAIATAPGDARAFHPAGCTDVSGFVAMGCDEILVHTWDAMAGLGQPFVADDGLAARILRRLFPWVDATAEPWPTLLWANGRIGVPGRAHPGPSWTWHAAPLADWDGTDPWRRDARATGHRP